VLVDELGGVLLRLRLVAAVVERDELEGTALDAALLVDSLERGERAVAHIAAEFRLAAGERGGLPDEERFGLCMGGRPDQEGNCRYGCQSHGVVVRKC